MTKYGLLLFNFMNKKIGTDLELLKSLIWNQLHGCIGQYTKKSIIIVNEN